MQNIQQIVNSLIDKKAKENNTIDLNAYAVGALDALEKSKYTEMLEMLNEFYLMCIQKTFPTEHELEYMAEKAEKLIKEATEL